MSGKTNNPWDIINEIKKDVGRIANKIAYGIANVALDDISKAHKEIMKSYYQGYTPVDHYYFYYIDKKGGHHFGITHGYRRTYNLGEGSRNPKGVFKKGLHTFRAVMSIDSENMDDYVNPITGRVFPASAVLDMVWDEGIRGLPPGYRGHIGKINIDADLYGIHMDNKPHEAMEIFLAEWGQERGVEIADNIEDYVTID